MRAVVFGAERNTPNRGHNLVQQNVLFISTPITERLFCFIMFTPYAKWGVVLSRTQLHRRKSEGRMSSPADMMETGKVEVPRG